MKKAVLSLLLALGFAFSASAQDLVTTTITEVTATTVTAHFEMSDACTQYAFMIDWQDNMDFFTQMFGCTEEQYILQFCNFFQTQDTTWTWDEQMPNREYIILVVAHSQDADPVIYRTTVTTLGQGTSDPSVISISVSEITDTSARVIFTPNEATMFYKDMIIEVPAMDSLGGIAGVRDFMITEGMLDEFASEDDWTWTTLEPGRHYAACAVGQNGGGEWGELCHYEFQTLGEAGIAITDNQRISVYPNPTTGELRVECGEMSARCIQLFDLNGREVLRTNPQSPISTLDLSSLPAGTYVLRADMGHQYAVQQIVKQ